MMGVVLVSAITAKTLKVDFNKEVDNTKATIEVVKSTIKQNVSKTTWAADNKSVELEMSAKLMKGDYTVNVKGLTDEVLTKTVTVEDERVESIEILSDIAVVNNTAAPTSATVGYQVKNQYGEDITKTTSVTNNGGVVTSSTNGVVTLTLNSTPGTHKVGDKVAIALVHAASAKSSTKVVTLSAAASVAEVEIKGLYNKDGKELNEATNLTNDKFYLLVDAKDQYGNVITNKITAAAGLIKSETNPTVIKTDGSNNNVTFTDVTVDGKKHLGIELQGPIKAGENQVTLISTTTGKNASYNIVVAETTRTDVVNLSSPALAVANEDILVPVTVLDKEGNAITDVKVLNDVDKGVKVTFTGGTVNSPAFVKDKDGNIFIKVSTTTDGVFPLVAQSSTFKVETSTITVKKAAVPTTIRGLKNPLALSVNNTKTIKVADVVVEDQYGREMKSADVLTYLTTNSKGILIEKADASSTVVTLPPGGVSNQTIKDSNGVVVTAGNKNGSETLQFVLADDDGTNKMAASTAESTVRVTDGTEYASYEIAPIGKVQASDVESAGAKEFTVNGILNGSKVALDPATDYTATISGGDGNASVSGDKISVATANLNTKKDTDGTTDIPVDTEFTLKVTINATGQVLEQKFVVSAEDKEVVDFFLTEEATDYDKAKVVTETELGSGDTIAEANKFKAKDGTKIYFATKDQYGNEEVVAVPATAKVTIVPEKVTELTIANNGTKDATATLKGVSESKVTLKITHAKATVEVKSIVKVIP